MVNGSRCASYVGLERELAQEANVHRIQTSRVELRPNQKVFAFGNDDVAARLSRSIRKAHNTALRRDGHLERLRDPRRVVLSVSKCFQRATRGLAGSETRGEESRRDREQGEHGGCCCS